MSKPPESDARFFERALAETGRLPPYPRTTGMPESYLNLTRKKTQQILDFSKTIIDIDQENRHIKILSRNGKIVGEIFLGEFLLGNERFPHCFLEVSDRYRKMGVGKKLFNLYKENFGVLDFEYTREPEKFHFFVSVGYSSYSIINDATGDEELLYGDNDEALRMLKEGYSVKLGYE